MNEAHGGCMGKVTSDMSISLDGFIAGPKKTLHFAPRPEWSQKPPRE
jgi:hypothetical protein